MKPNGRLKDKDQKVIGMCNYEYHRGDISWDIINSEGCLKGNCDHFSWVSLKDRDQWRKENGYEKRNNHKRADAAKKRVEDKKMCAPTPIEIINKIEKLNNNKPLTITVTLEDNLYFYTVDELSLTMSGIEMDDIKYCMLDYARELGINNKSKSTNTKDLIMKELYKLYKTSRSKYVQFLKLDSVAKSKSL